MRVSYVTYMILFLMLATSVYNIGKVSISYTGDVGLSTPEYFILGELEGLLAIQS